MKKYFIFVGNFGSGKSELAINMALERAAMGPCTLADLDVINPYFRSGERGDVLSAAGIRLIAPPFALHKIEIMSLPPEIYSIFAKGEGSVIIDAGGDPVGATALGQYKPNFDNIPQENVEVLMVINPFRPLADTTEKAVDLLRRIEMTCRLSVTGLINNANLAGETSAEDILDGCRAVSEISDMTGIPIWGTAGTKKPLEGFVEMALKRGIDPSRIGRVFEIEVNMHRTWDKYINEGL